MRLHIASVLLVFNCTSLAGCHAKDKKISQGGSSGGVSLSVWSHKIDPSMKATLAEHAERCLGEVESVVSSFKSRPSSAIGEIKRQLIRIKAEGIRSIDSMIRKDKGLKESGEGWKIKILRNFEQALLELNKRIKDRNVFEVSIHGLVAGRAGEFNEIVDARDTREESDMKASMLKVLDKGIGEIQDLVEAAKTDDDVVMKELAEKGIENLKKLNAKSFDELKNYFILQTIVWNFEKTVSESVNSLRENNLGPVSDLKFEKNKIENLVRTHMGGISLFGKGDSKQKSLIDKMEQSKDRVIKEVNQLLVGELERRTNAEYSKILQDELKGDRSELDQQKVIEISSEAEQVRGKAVETLDSLVGEFDNKWKEDLSLIKNGFLERFQEFISKYLEFIAKSKSVWRFSEEAIRLMGTLVTAFREAALKKGEVIAKVKRIASEFSQRIITHIGSEKHRRGWTDAITNIEDMKNLVFQFLNTLPTGIRSGRIENIPSFFGKGWPVSILPSAGSNRRVIIPHSNNPTQIQNSETVETPKPHPYGTGSSSELVTLNSGDIALYSPRGGSESDFVQKIKRIQQDCLESMESIMLKIDHSLTDILQTVFEAQVKIARRLMEALPKIYILVAGEESLAATNSAVETLQRKVEEMIEELNLLLPTEIDSNRLKKKRLYAMLARSCEKLIRALKQGSHEEILLAGKRALRSQAVSNIFTQDEDIAIPPELSWVLDSFRQILVQNSLNVKSILNRFNVIVGWIKNAPVKRKIFLLTSAASVVRQELLDISHSGTLGETAVLVHSYEYHDLLSDTYDELIKKGTATDEGEDMHLGTTWLASLLKVFVSSHALGPVDTFIQLSGVVTTARSDLSTTGTDGRKHERVIKELISVEMNLISEIENLSDNETGE